MSFFDVNPGGAVLGKNSIVPVPANAAGFTKLLLFDDFNDISQIDVTNSQQSGKTWYIANAWPNMVSPFGNFTTTPTDPPSPTNLFTVKDSVLTISNNPNQSGLCLQTACAKSNANGFIGQVFSGGFYVEARFAFDATKTVFNKNPPAVWMNAVEGLTGAATTFSELDLFEAIANGAGGAGNSWYMHQWNNLTQGFWSNTNPTNNTPGYGGDLSYHTYGTLYKTQAQNGGSGLIQRYVDGIHLQGPTWFNDITFSATGPVSPGATPTNPNGMFSLIDSQRMMLILVGGYNCPIYIDYVAVWGTP